MCRPIVPDAPSAWQRSKAPRSTAGPKEDSLFPRGKLVDVIEVALVFTCKVCVEVIAIAEPNRMTMQIMQHRVRIQSRSPGTVARVQYLLLWRD